MSELVPLSSLLPHSLHHHVNHAFTINTQYLPTFQNLPMSPKQKKSCRIPIKVRCLQCYHSTSSASTLKYREFSGSYYSSPKRKVVSPYLKKHIRHPVHPLCLKYYQNKNLINNKGDFDFLSSLVTPWCFDAWFDASNASDAFPCFVWCFVWCFVSDASDAFRHNMRMRTTLTFMEIQ